MIGGLLVFILFLSIYSLGISPSPLGGDSGDIILSYYFGGVAHPPGYPLNTLLGFILTHGPLMLVHKPFVWRANYVSAVYQALALSLLFIFNRQLTKNVIVSAFGTFVLGFSVLFWIYAHGAEVFQLTLVLVLVSMIFLFKYWSLPKLKRNDWDIWFSIFFFGLAVFHHQTALLLIPAYLYFIWQNKKKLLVRGIVLKLFVFFFLGILPYFWDIYQGFVNNFYNWSKPTTFQEFFRLIARADYGTFSASKDLVGFTLQQRILQIIWYFKVFRADFTLFGICIFVLGIFYMFIKERKYMWFLLLAWFFTGPFFLFYSAFPILQSFTKGVSERFFLNSYLFAAIFIGYGALALVNLARNFLYGKIIKSSALFNLLCLSIMLFPLVLLIINWPRADLTNYHIGSILARDILSSADPPGIIVTGGDTVSFNTQVSYFIDGIGGDSAIINLGRLAFSWYRMLFMQRYPQYIYPDNFKSDKKENAADVVWTFFDANYGKVPFYFYDKFETPKGYELVQQGMLLRMYKESDIPNKDDLEKIIFELDSEIKFNIFNEQGKYKQFFADQIEGNYTEKYFANGQELLKVDKYPQSRYFFGKALDIDRDYKQSLYGMGVSYIEEKECQHSREFFEKLLSLDSNYWQAYEGLAKVEEVCTGDKDKLQEYLTKSQEIRKKSVAVPIE